MTEPNSHKPIDHAPTAGEAWDLAHEYRTLMDVLGITDHRVGVEPDPVPGVDGRYGYTVYAVPVYRVPEPREPGDNWPTEFEIGGEG